METLHTLITDKDTGRDRAAFSDTDLCGKEAANLGATTPTEGAALVSLRSTRLQEADAERAKQAHANALAFVHQAKQKMGRAYTLLSSVLHLFPCQNDHLFGARSKQFECIH